MAIPQTGNTQAERLAAILVQLKPDVSAQDRKDACDKLQTTNANISRYLKGQVLDNDTAVKMIAFFRKKIAEREKAIA